MLVAAREMSEPSEGIGFSSGREIAVMESPNRRLAQCHRTSDNTKETSVGMINLAA
jgi:hypothetical protein